MKNHIKKNNVNAEAKLVNAGLLTELQAKHAQLEAEYKELAELTSAKYESFER